MKNVGIRELKNHLSEYLYLVKGGEVIVVTNHHKIVAEIRQPLKRKPGYKKKKQEIEAYLAELAGKNRLRRACRSFSLVDTLTPTKKLSAEYEWKNIYQKVREDRF